MTVFDFESFWVSETQMHKAVAEKTFQTLSGPFGQCLDVCMQSIENGGKLLFFGNGGSAADAQHLATEFTVRYVENRDPIAAIALTTDTSSLTAIGNDLGFDRLFARQIEALGREGDVAIGISTSGTSGNVLAGLEQARKQGLLTVGFTGESGGTMHDVCDVLLCIPSTVTARIQEMHITLGQMLCGALERKLGLIK